MAETLLDTLAVKLLFKGDRRELDRFERGIKNVNQRLNNLVRPLTIAGTAGAAALGLIGKAGLDTEKALLRMRAALGLTEEQMKTIREEALRVGSRLPLNTADIVRAGEAYGKLGATFQEILQDTPAIAGAAVATGLQPEQVATYARIIQNVFGGDVQENLDLMVRLANRGNARFAQLGESLQFSGQSAADAGLDFKTYIAVLGGVAGAGRSVESVAQGLTGMWARLAKANEDIGRGGAIVMESFEGVGISFEDVSAKMDGTAEGFVNVLSLINEAGLSTSQLTALLSTLAGDTYSASISYAVQNPEAIRELLDEAALAPGEIVRQQDIILSGASGGITTMIAQIDTLLNRLAESGTLTAIQNFTKAVSALIGWLTKTNEEKELVNKGFLRLISAFVMALAAMLVVAAALKVTTFALSGFVLLVKAARGVVWLWRNALIATRIQLGLLAVQTWLAAVANSNFILSLRLAAINVRGFVASLSLAKVAQLAGAAATGIASAATWAFNAALLANPITWIVLGIAALIAALVLLVKHWDTVKRVVRDFFDRYGNYVLAALAVVAPFIAVPLLIAKNWSRIVEIVGGIWSRVNDTVRGWIEAIIDFVRELPGRVVGILKDIPGMVADAIRDIPGLGGAIKVFTEIADRIPFAKGGIVPGPLGRPLLATVHGGEMVLPVGASRVIAQMLKGFQLGPAALPQAPPGYGQMYRSLVDNRTVTVHIHEPIVIHTEATDAKGIAQEIGEVIQDQIRNVAYDHDGPVER